MPIRPLRLALALLVTAGCDRPDAEPAGSVPAEPTATAAVTAAPAACDEDDGGITLPDGFCARVVAEVGPARHLAVADDGTLYVKLRRVEGGGGIVALRDTTGDHRADVEARFGDFGGTGVAVHDGYLYASSDLAVYRWPLPTDGLVPEGEPTAIVEGFPRQDQHAAKPLAFDGAGGLYVTVGADANACQEQTRTPGSPGQDPCPLLDTSGGIWRFEAGAAGQSFSADARYATGVRHAVALAWNPAEGALYAVQHGRDQLHQLWPEHYTEQENADLPAEELLRLEAGADAGWPYCYYDWQEGQKELAPEYGGTGSEVGRCDGFVDPVVAFPGHWAPNGLAFYTADAFPARYRGGAFVAFHGSWNRAPLPQAGYNVAFAPLDGSGDYEVFADGFAGEEQLESPGDARFRPMSVAVGPDGALYIGDSVEGRIWRVVYRGDTG